MAYIIVCGIAEINLVMIIEKKDQSCEEHKIQRIPRDV